MRLHGIGTLNYRKVNLSGGLAIGEFSSSIIKLFPMAEWGRGRARGAAGGMEIKRGGDQALVEIKCAERMQSGTAQTREIACVRRTFSGANCWHFPYTRNNMYVSTGENFSSFGEIDLVIN